MMLFGEHSILREGKAVAVAIDRWLSIEIRAQEGETIEIFSSFGRQRCSCNNISLNASLRFVEAALKRFQLHKGCSITICSDIDPTMGLGSSASVSVAMMAALSAWTGQSWSKEKLLKETISLIQSVQECGSGADAASIIYGGVISFDGKRALPLTPSLPLVAKYCGYKTPTPQVIAHVAAQEKRFPDLFESLFSSIDTVTNEAIYAIEQDDLPHLGECMNRADGLMNALGVGTFELSDICWRFRKEPTIFGAKISGSGLGDCAVALGHSQHKSLPVSVSPLGVFFQ
jgi:mevalonate kinase